MPSNVEQSFADPHSVRIPQWLRWARNSLQGVLEFAFPLRCPLCQQALAAGFPANCPAALCDACCARLEPLIDQHCQRCGGPVGPNVDATQGCQLCQRDCFRFRTVLPLGIYQGWMQVVCQSAKEPRGRDLTAALSGLLLEKHSEFLTENAFDAVVSVPHHWTQRLSQTHHAADVMAAVFAHQLGIPLARHAVHKTQRTPSQSGLPPSQRRRNLNNAFFAVSDHRIKGGRILVTDDILTTGTTANEVSKALLQAGAADVVVAVIARGIGQQNRHR